MTHCANLECDGEPVDFAVHCNERMDHQNGEHGFCAKCLQWMADPLGSLP